MAKEVIKKDGTKESFEPEKIRKSIRAAAKRTRLSEKRKKAVIEQVAGAAIKLAESKEEIATTDIRKKILKELDKVAPSVSAAWRKYEQTNK